MSRTPLVHLDESLEGSGPERLVSLRSHERHHLRSVLRLDDGDPVELSDGLGGYAAGELTGRGVRLSGPASFSPPPRPTLRVVQALPKGRKLDEVVRVGVELGMDELIPVAAERSVRRPEGARAAKATERWAAVARSACEQARRLHRPRIAGVSSVEDLNVEGRWLLAHPGAADSLPDVLEEPVDAAGGRGDVTIAIGPEGGWSETEVALLEAAGARSVHFGPNVLRTEHAAAAALAVIGASVGRWSTR